MKGYNERYQGGRGAKGDGNAGVMKQSDTVINNSAEKQLRAGKTVKIMPQGWSMHPTIDPGNSVILFPVFSGDTLKKGRIYLYRRKPEKGGILVLHRLVKIKPDGLYFCGDQQWDIEGPLDRDQVLGRVYSISKKDGKDILVDKASFKAKSAFWMLLFPFRKVIVKRGAALKKKVKKKK